MPYIFTDLIRRSYRDEMAYRHVGAISQYHRIQASPGFRAAAQYVADQLAAAGLEVAIRRYPANSTSHFWATPSFLEWSCENASLDLLDEHGALAENLCDFAAVPTSLIQRSIPAAGEFEVVAPGGKGGVEPADYAGLDVSGKLVLTDQAVARVLELAVRERGAAGVLFDGMKSVGRTALDVPDARQYTSFWYPGAIQPDGWGFVISPRQGQSLRRKLADGKPVRVRAMIDSRFYEGAIEVVETFIPGTSDGPDEEILLLSHLCHPRPGAHDNGSGVAALIETAATLARLIAEGQLPPPRRGIRFIWPPEMTGTYAWLAEHEADVKRGRWIAGLNLDMVGADQGRTGSTWQLIDLPQAGAAFADHLLSWLREPFLDGQRYSEVPFSAGSDHYILCDPSVGIPTPMLNQWPDKFYHTSADTPDKVSPDSLGRSGALAAVYAYWLASAGLAEARWLGHWMVTRFAVQAGKEAAEAAEALRATENAARRARIWAQYRRQSAFHAERMASALGSLGRLAPEMGAEIADLRAQITANAAREDAWVRSQVDADTLGQTNEEDEPWRAEAMTLIPQRRSLGPISVGMAMPTQAKELREAYWKMSTDAGADHALDEMAALLQYWADGQRTIAEIADLVALETGQTPGDLPLRFFKLLAKTGQVTLKSN